MSYSVLSYSDCLTQTYQTDVFYFIVLGDQSKQPTSVYGQLVTKDQLVAIAARTQGSQNDLVTLHSPTYKFRDPTLGPLRKLSADLIKTYKHINEVSNICYTVNFRLIE